MADARGPFVAESIALEVECYQRAGRPNQRLRDLLRTSYTEIIPTQTIRKIESKIVNVTGIGNNNTAERTGEFLLHSGTCHTVLPIGIPRPLNT